jgi:transcriptional regulator with XRE-family HTH domain
MAKSSNRLARLRAAAGLSTHALGKLAGVAQPLVWRFEHGTTPKGLVAAYKLAAALGVRVPDIWPELPVVGTRRPTPSPQPRLPGGAKRRTTPRTNAQVSRGKSKR